MAGLRGNPWEIRDGVPADLVGIDAFDPFAGDRHAELREGRCLVAEDAGTITAYATFSRAGFIGRPFVHYLAVAPERRRTGLASALLRGVEGRVGPGRLFLSTEEGNAPMRGLLERDGWVPAGCVRGVNEDGSAECFYYRDVGGVVSLDS